jgi:hypothetical protein
MNPYATGLGGKTFDLQILDKNLKVLHSATYPYSMFSTGPAWLEFRVPNIEVTDKFYVHIYTDSPYPGLHIGVDDSVINQHSDVTVRTAEGAVGILVMWPYNPTSWFGDKSKVNWMIRVEGTYTVPSPTPTLTPSPTLTATPTPMPTPTPTLTPKEVELKYDDGQARDCISTVSPSFGGHIVDFSSPAMPFTIKKVRIAGGISSFARVLAKGKTFDLQILDKNLKVLYSATYPYTRFPVFAAVWVEFEVPDIEVTDKFYIHIYTDSPYPGLYIGVDDSVINQHSDVTVRTAEGTITILAKWPYNSSLYDPNIVAKWPSLWWGDKSKVNWMIRVEGTYFAR